MHKGFATLSLALIGAIALLMSIGFLIEKEKRKNLLHEIDTINNKTVETTPTFSPIDYGPRCRSIKECGEDISEVNCGPEVDGPLFYINTQDGEVITTCGGACMGGGCDIDRCNDFSALCTKK